MRKSAPFVSILLVSLCAIVLIMALAVPAFAADSGYLDALLKQAEQEPDTTTGPEASEANQNSADGEQPSTEALWWLIPALLAVSVAIIWAICNRKR